MDMFKQLLGLDLEEAFEISTDISYRETPVDLPMAVSHGLKCRILKPADLKREKMGLLTGVGLDFAWGADQAIAQIGNGLRTKMYYQTPRVFTVASVGDFTEVITPTVDLRRTTANTAEVVFDASRLAWQHEQQIPAVKRIPGGILRNSLARAVVAARLTHDDRVSRDEHAGEPKVTINFTKLVRGELLHNENPGRCPVDTGRRNPEYLFVPGFGIDEQAVGERRVRGIGTLICDV